MVAIEEVRAAPTLEPRDLTIPERARARGPVSRARLRRTAIGFAVLWAVGFALAYGTDGPATRAFGLGLVLPGAGFAYAVDNPVLATAAVLASVLVLVLALVAWFGSGNIIAPPAAWLGAAGLAALAAGGGGREAARPAVAGIAAAVVVLGALNQKRADAASRRKGRERNEYLTRIAPEVRSPSRETGPELDADDLAHMRWAIDTALQPKDRFDGFDIVDQFQTSAIRYQLNFLDYALASAQAFRTPAFTGYLSAAQRALIEKMTERRVWSYWRWENLWGNFDPDPDPMKRDNIMLSGYMGLMLGLYASNTGDDRYSVPGSLPFRWNEHRVFAYDHPRIAEAVAEGFESSPWGLFPCEPNWIYTACNTFGMNTLMLADRLFGTRHVDQYLADFERGFEEEFVRPDGRVTAIRSSRLGLTIPSLTSTMADTGTSVFVEPLLPELAQRCWEIVRAEFVGIREHDVDLELRGWDKIDTGNYRLAPVSAYAILYFGAREKGDTELAAALLERIEATLGPERENGRLRYASASTFANATILHGRLTRAHGFADMVASGPASVALEGPHLADAPYPDCLVARAVTDGKALELVLRPGGNGGRVPLLLEGLVPGSRYRLAGAVQRSVKADDSGHARIEVDLDDRTEIRATPAR